MRLSFYPVTRQNAFAHVTLLPPPRVPWQITGNHWVALPCIHPADASIHAIGMVHRAARSAIELAGGPDFVSGNEPALLKPTLDIAGVRRALSDVPIAWERALGWIPTFTCTVDDLVLRGTIFAPYGRDADVSGAVYALSIENRRKQDVAVDVTLSGTLGHRQLRVRTPRPFEDAGRVSQGASGAIILEGSSLPELVAVALSADGDATTTVDGQRYSLRRSVQVKSGGR